MLYSLAGSAVGPRPGARPRAALQHTFALLLRRQRRQQVLALVLPAQALLEVARDRCRDDSMHLFVHANLHAFGCASLTAGGKVGGKLGRWSRGLRGNKTRLP